MAQTRIIPSISIEISPQVASSIEIQFSATVLTMTALDVYGEKSLTWGGAKEIRTPDLLHAMNH